MCLVFLGMRCNYQLPRVCKQGGQGRGSGKSPPRAQRGTWLAELVRGRLWGWSATRSAAGDIRHIRARAR